MLQSAKTLGANALSLGKIIKPQSITLVLLGSIVASLSFSGTAKAEEGLVNFNFEDSASIVGLNRYKIINESAVAGWQTTDSGIEIWGDGFRGVSAGEGSYFAEINANKNGTLFQEVSDIEAGQAVGFSFMHRARRGTDVMKLSITDLGTDNIFGTDDDTTMFAKNYSATTEGWVLNTSENEDSILTLGNNMRFAYSAVSTGSSNASVGNFLDAANFGLASEVLETEDSQKVPEPASLLGLAAIAGAAALKRKRSGSV